MTSQSFVEMSQILCLSLFLKYGLDSSLNGSSSFGKMAFTFLYETSTRLTVRHNFIIRSLHPDYKVHGPTWGPPGSCRPQKGPMLASWSLLSGNYCNNFWISALPLALPNGSTWGFIKHSKCESHYSLRYDMFLYSYQTSASIDISSINYIYSYISVVLHWYWCRLWVKRVQVSFNSALSIL